MDSFKKGTIIDLHEARWSAYHGLLMFIGMYILLDIVGNNDSVKVLAYVTEGVMLSDTDVSLPG